MKLYQVIGLSFVLASAALVSVAQPTPARSMALGEKPTGLPTFQASDLYVTSRATQLTDLNNVDGTPYADNEFKYGFIRSSTGEMFSNVQVRFNALNNEVEFIQNNVVLALTSVDSVAYLVTKGDSSSLRVFKNGYPATEKLTSKTIYEVLTPGSAGVQLLKYSSTSAITTKRMGEGKERIQFNTNSEYYAYVNGKMVSFKPGKKSILEAFPEYKTEISDILKSSNLDLKTEIGIQDLFRELNLQIASKKAF